MTNTQMQPLKFVPIVKALPWGGLRLNELFSKTLPDDLPYGESWEIVDLPEDQSVVTEGPLAGSSLAELVENRKDELLGETSLLMGRFPVLFKLIDAKETLSVQVHPDEQTAAWLGRGARPKTEAWYILHTDPGAGLYVGLNEGVDKDQFRKALESGNLKELLHFVEVKSGDFIFLPSGTLHAIGGGILLAEIQQASNTTYRVFDWNRKGLDGKQRTLHIEEAMQSIHFDVRGRPAHATPLSGRPGIHCDSFVFERAGLGSGSQLILDAGRPRIVCCLEGAGQVSDLNASLSLRTGETCLVPACSAASLSTGSGGTFLLVRI